MTTEVPDLERVPEGIDPTSAQFFVRPDYHDVLRALRRYAPVHPCAPGLWTIASHEDIRAVGRDPDRFCSGKGALINDPIRWRGADGSVPALLHLDPPMHGEFRSTVNRRFAPRALASLEDRIAQLAVQVIEDAPPDEVIDFVGRLGAPFPMLVISELLGIPDGDRSDFRRWSDATIELPDHTGEPKTALAELAAYLGALIADKRRNPGDDLVSLLLGSEVDGRPFRADELFMFLLTLLVAGNETTRTLLTGSVDVLAAHPGQRAELAHTPDLTAGAVEECLRWVTPVHAFCRTATVDLSLHGRQIAAGDYVVLLYASGNRDESVFGPSSGSFDVTRAVQPQHVAFGFGEHVCLGATLARMEARVFVRELLARYPSYEVVGPPGRVASTIVAGIESLPVVLRP